MFGINDLAQTDSEHANLLEKYKNLNKTIKAKTNRPMIKGIAPVLTTNCVRKLIENIIEVNISLLTKINKLGINLSIKLLNL